MKDFFIKLKNILMSRPPVGGLEISGSALKLLVIKSSTSILQASLQLPPGILEQGRIVDRENFVAALKDLHAQIAPLNKMLNVVVNIPSQLVYAQNFSIPILEKDHLEEAADLNLQMISPTPAEETYSDWQEIKENPDANHLDLLGAFASSTAMNEYTAALNEASFSIVAIEFPGLALARLIKERWQDLTPGQHYLLIHLNQEGILMLILKNGNLSFNHFTTWQTVLTASENKEITFEAIRSFFIQELHRVVNYYFGRTGKTLTEAILISSLFNYEIVQVAKEQFSLQVKNLALGGLPDLLPSWFVALGSALRGLVDRAHDAEISLTETNTQTEYYQSRVLTFVSIWRNIIVATMVFIFIAFFVMDIVFARQEGKLKAQTEQESVGASNPEVILLTQKAGRFNTALHLIEKAGSSETAWSPFLSRIANLTGTSITLHRIFADRSNLSALLTGSATNELVAINFKNRLAKEPNIINVELPLSDIKTEKDSTATFTLTLKLKSLDF